MNRTSKSIPDANDGVSSKIDPRKLWEQALRDQGQELSRCEVAVLMAIKRRANMELEAWPSLETIAEDSRYSKRQAQRGLAGAAAKGWVIVPKGKHGGSYKKQASTHVLTVPSGTSAIMASDTSAIVASVNQGTRAIYDMNSRHACPPKNNIEENKDCCKQQAEDFKDVVRSEGGSREENPLAELCTLEDFTSWVIALGLPAEGKPGALKPSVAHFYSKFCGALMALPVAEQDKVLSFMSWPEGTAQWKIELDKKASNTGAFIKWIDKFHCDPSHLWSAVKRAKANEAARASYVVPLKPKDIDKALARAKDETERDAVYAACYADMARCNATCPDTAWVFLGSGPYGQPRTREHDDWPAKQAEALLNSAKTLADSKGIPVSSITGNPDDDNKTTNEKD
jgi:hypothetical protein